MDSFLHFFNLIDKADGLRGDIIALARRKGGGVGIEFLPPAGSSGADVERMLARYGVSMWGRGIPRSNKDDATMSSSWCCCRVRRSQADWARYLIARYGCQLSGETPKSAPVGMPTPWADKTREVASPKAPTPNAKPKVRRKAREIFDRLLR